MATKSTQINMQTSYLIAAILLIFGAILLAQNQGYLQVPEQQLPQEKECSSDNECAPAGCSGQICVPANKAAEIITTCEYRPEYMCLRTSASCSCIQNRCNWKYQPNYEQCVVEARVRYGAERIA